MLDPSIMICSRFYQSARRYQMVRILSIMSLRSLGWSLILLFRLLFLLSLSTSRMLAMMNPGESWVAQWQNQRSLRPGLYAVAVEGALTEGEGDHGEDFDDLIGDD